MNKRFLRLYIVVMVCICVAICGGCNVDESKPDQQVTRMIRNLNVHTNGDSEVLFYGVVCDICGKIEEIGDIASKTNQLKALAGKLAGIDLADYNSYECTLIFSSYWRSICVVCTQMLDNGILDDENFRLVLAVWKKCQDMCGKPQQEEMSVKDSIHDLAECKSNERKLRGMFENDATLFERDILRIMLEGRNVEKSQKLKLYDMWHKEFGCRVDGRIKNHDEYRR